MNVVYFKEQESYKIGDIKDKLAQASDKKDEIFKKLRHNAIINKRGRVNNYNLDNLDSEDMPDIVVENDSSIPSDSEEYVFNFVGVIVVCGLVVIVYPKYFSTIQDSDIANGNISDFLEKVKQVVQVIRRYNNEEKNQKISVYADDSSYHDSNFLGLAEFFLQDYFDNGIYTNEYIILENNGNGEIDWNKTITNNAVVIQNGIPIYVDMKTRKRVSNKYDYFKRLHECILTDISKSLCQNFDDMTQFDLAEVLDITTVELSDELIEDFGDDNYIIYMLEKELSQQFQTRKQILLKAMIAYIENKGTFNDDNTFSFYGTNRFNLIWEKACADALNNRLDDIVKQLKNQGFDIFVQGINEDITLKELIDKPYWSETGEYSRKTLTPDIVSIEVNKVNENSRESTDSINVQNDYENNSGSIGANKEAVALENSVGSGENMKIDIVEDNRNSFVEERGNISVDFVIYDAKYYVMTFNSLKGEPGVESITKQYLYQLAFKKYLIPSVYNNIKNIFILPSDNDIHEKKGEVSLDFINGIASPIQIIFLSAREVYKCYLERKSLNI